jgi:hypothetical protein
MAATMEFIGDGSALIKVFEGLAIVRVGGGE